MKTGFVSLILALFACLPAVQATTPAINGRTNYVVIGAFSNESNAVRFAEAATNGQYHAEFALNSDRKLYYVYVLTTDDKQKAFEVAARLRAETAYWDSWVFSGLLGAEPSRSEDLDPATGSAINQVIAVDQDAPGQPETNVKAAVIDNPEPNVTSAPNLQEGMAARAVKFQVYSAAKGKPLEASVDMIEVENARKVASYRSNEVVTVPFRVGAPVTWMCDLFGYRKQQKTIDLSAPGDYATGDDGALIIPFEMVRLRKGDIAVMYNVYFFKDAAIMRPESQYEVNNLLEMLKENPNYKIRIHGHTNGNAAGKIITMGPESKSYFSLSGSKSGFGSAKKLSATRAEVIKNYLMSEGIEEGRLLVKAWGGKRPLFDKHHAQAASNVRVEIEIVEE